MRLFRLAHGECLGAVVLLLAIALSGSARAALVGADDRDSDAPFDITADTVEFESDRDLFIARGNVVITQPGRTLTADWVAFSSETRQGVVKSTRFQHRHEPRRGGAEGPRRHS